MSQDTDRALACLVAVLPCYCGDRSDVKPFKGGLRIQEAIARSLLGHRLTVNLPLPDLQSRSNLTMFGDMHDVLCSTYDENMSAINNQSNENKISY